jgi:hypothetical protein
MAGKKRKTDFSTNKKKNVHEIKAYFPLKKCDLREKNPNPRFFLLSEKSWIFTGAGDDDDGVYIGVGLAAASHFSLFVTLFM